LLKQKNIPESEDWKIDCAAAVENMLIAAVAQGLGPVGRNAGL
jgi:nitroreductase